MTADQAQSVALVCPWDAAALTFEGMYGPRSARFARWQCPSCETSYPEGSNSILRQL